MGSIIFNDNSITNIDTTRLFFNPVCPQYTITAMSNPTAGGTTAGAGEYFVNDLVTLTAIPAEGYYFVNWTEDWNIVSTDPDYSFTVDGDRDLVANFMTNTYTITATANPATGGTTTGAGKYYLNEEATLTTIPDEGYSFVNWTEDGNLISIDPVYSFTVTEDRYLTARFIINTYSITAIASPFYGGTISGDGIYKYGVLASMTAAPHSNYSFDKWTVDGETVSMDKDYSFIVVQSLELVANFVAGDGIDDTENVIAEVYPNPTDGYVRIGCDNMTQVTVLTFSGAALYVDQNVTDNVISIDMRNYKDGMYIIRITTTDGIINRKVVKIR